MNTEATTRSRSYVSAQTAPEGRKDSLGTLARAVRSAMPWIRSAGYVVSPLVSIGAGGFIIRRELEASARAMLGAAQGVAHRCCGGRDAED